MQIRYPFCVFLIVFLLLNFLRVSAQKNAYRYFNFSVEQGLPDNTVRCFAKDRNGFLWIGTHSGLSRFDGVRFRNFTCDPTDTNSLSSNLIIHLYQDKTGLLWISTQDNGLNSFDPQTNQFKRYFQESRSSSRIPNNHPTAVCEDKNGNLWIGFFGKGIARYNREKDQFHLVSFDDRKDGYNFNEIKDIKMDKEGIFWISTRDGLVKFNPNNLKHEKIEQREKNGLKKTDKNLFQRIQISQLGDIYLGTWVDGIYAYTPTTKQWKHFEVDKLSTGYANKINDFAFIGDQKILFTSYYHGFGILDIATKNYSYLTIENKTSSKTPNLEDGISIYPTGEDIFLGTNDGFTRMSQRPKSIFEFDGSNLKFDFENGINVISTFLPFENDSLFYAGTYYRNGVYAFSKKTGFAKYEIPLNSTRGNLVIFSSLKSRYKQGTYYLATSKGLLQFSSSKSYELTSVQLPNALPRESAVSTITYDSKNRLWLSLKDALFCWDESSGQLINKSEEFKKSSKLETLELQQLFGDSKGNIWIVNDQKRLFQYNPTSKSVRFFNDGNPSESILQGNVEEVLEDRNGNIWINMISIGLARYSPISGKLIYFTANQGLLSSRIFSFTKDKQGNIWVLSEKGVSVVNAETCLIRNFTKKQGFEIAQSNVIQYHDDGYIYMGGMDIAYRFKPEDILIKNQAGTIYITDIDIFLKPYKSSKPYNSLDTIKLDHTQNYIRFQFTIPDIGSSIDYYYYSKLEGIDKDWVLTGKEGNVVFSNLENGTYTFRLRAKNGAGEWCSGEKIITLIVQPPFWKSTWFLLSLILITGILIVLIYRYRVNQIRKKALQKNLLQKQLNELENKALRSQMNPHFIFNSLNSINSYIIKNKPDEASAYVSKFARLIRLILDNSRETHIALESELMALNLYIEIENKRFANKFSWNIQIHSSIDIHTTWVPPMIIQPFVENAIWHGLLHQEKPGVLTISLQEKSGYLEISIDDNGIGRDAAQQLKSKSLLKDKSHGMEVTIKRIENFNAGFSLGKAVEIIDKKDEFGNPTGTTMLLKIALIKNEQEIP